MRGAGFKIASLTNMECKHIWTPLYKNGKREVACFKCKLTPAETEYVCYTTTNIEKIDLCRWIADNHQALQIDNVIVDAFSATAILLIFDKLNETNKMRFVEMPINKMGKKAINLIA